MRTLDARTTEALTTEAALTDEDFAGFLSAHASMRVEYGRLAGAARTAADPARIELIEEQISLATSCLHHHHTSEDNDLWPRLRQRAPESRGELEELEQEHAVVDPLIARVSDRSIPLRERAGDLATLEAALNVHLDHEEAVALPLIKAHFTRSEWEAMGVKILAEMREVLPLILCMSASALTEGERSAIQSHLPEAVQALFTTVWWPAYERRFTTLYGPELAPAIAASV